MTSGLEPNHLISLVWRQNKGIWGMPDPPILFPLTLLRKLLKDTPTKEREHTVKEEYTGDCILVHKGKGGERQRGVLGQ